MTYDEREQVDAELMEVAELIPEWRHELSPEEFWREIAERIQAFRLYYPVHGDYACERIEEFLTSCGLQRPSEG